MSPQQAFDCVAARLADGTGRCVDHGGDCLYYRAEDGNRCAIGALMPLQMAKRIGCRIIDIEHLRVRDTAVSKRFSGLDIKLLQDLQAAHDNGAWSHGNFIGWELMRTIAKRHRLSPLSLAKYGALT